MKRLINMVFILFLISLVLFNINFSQPLNLQTFPSDNTQIGLTFDKAFYSSDNKYSLFTGVFQLSSNTPISDNLNLLSNLPILNMSYEIDNAYRNYEYSESGLGNLFVGLQTNSDFKDNSRAILSFGVFLPTSDEDIAYLGTRINSYDLQKYLPNTLGLYFNYALQKLTLNGLNLCFEVGPNVLIPTKWNGKDLELLLHYGLNIGYQIEKIMLNAEFLGMGIITEDVDDFEDRLIHQINFGAQWKGGIVAPMVYYRIYLKEEFRDVIKGVLGLGIKLTLD